MEMKMAQKIGNSRVMGKQAVWGWRRKKKKKKISSSF